MGTGLLVVMIATSITQAQAEQVRTASFSNSLSTGVVIPLNGTIYVSWGRPVVDRLVLSNYVAFFERDWMVALEKGDWHSNTFYIGTMLQYFPTSQPGNYTGYYLGGDAGLASSRQTYRPLDKSDVFFFPYAEVYLFGYVFPIRGGLNLDLCLGGGYAPVSHIVSIEGHRNEGNYYPLADVRLTYRW